MHLKDPVKLFDIGLNRTRLLLDYAVSHRGSGFVYASTYEIYGEINSDSLIKEDQACILDPLVLRNSYAEIKRLCESLCVAYSSKYGINVFSGRLTSTLGTGVSYKDPRVFAEFEIYENQEGKAFNYHYQANGYHPLVCYDGLTGDLLKISLRDCTAYSQYRSNRIPGAFNRRI